MTTPNTKDNMKDTKDTKDTKDVKAAPAVNSKKAEDADETEGPKRSSRKIYIVTGTVLEFQNAREAEKRLNSDTSIPADCTIIKGNILAPKKKVSLR